MRDYIQNIPIFLKALVVSFNKSCGRKLSKRQDNFMYFQNFIALEYTSNYALNLFQNGMYVVYALHCLKTCYLPSMLQSRQFLNMLFFSTLS